MPRDKTESHERIVGAAKKEFLEYGFADASLRRIAADAKIQVSGLYRHFASKEEMFADLVEPVVGGFYSLYSQIEDEYFEGLRNADESFEMNGHDETVRIMEYIYDHHDEFVLIITKSSGTKYENFRHDIAKLEEEVTLRYMESLKSAGYHVKDINRNEFHLLVTAYIESVFQAVSHGFSQDEAMHYARTLEDFYGPAWRTWFGI
ncbi:MAG: TetR/AcrR family transcriptional regulator [Lachnospiraceae bacterium]|nr:TetR/AcrR family transcriptional regulator [Lachnospiraceae bacterium]